METNLEKKRKAQIFTNALVVGLSVYYVVKEQEDANKVEKRQQRKYWVSPKLSERRSKGRFARFFERMTKTPRVFFDNFHMTVENFNQLFALVEPHLVPKKNTRPDAIPLKEKLAIVIEMLATGDVLHHVCSSYRISKQHMGVTVDLVCDAISNALSKEFPLWDEENMLKWAAEFEKQCELPNCIGAIDGKHLRLRGPSNSCTTFNNYQGFNSIVLMAVSDASYRFTYIELGAYQNEDNTSAFAQCKLGDSILSGRFNFPEDRMLNDVSVPYFLAGNKAFPLHTRLMKPYFGKSLTKSEMIFNDRLERACSCTEKAFGILSSRWRAVQNTMLCMPKKAHKIVSACCALHNFMMRSNAVDLYLPDHVESATTLTDLEPFQGRCQDNSKYVRYNLNEYLNSQSGSVSWQY